MFLEGFPSLFQREALTMNVAEIRRKDSGCCPFEDVP
jgi:hypothetical protein